MLQNKEITGYTYAEKSVEDKIKDILIFAFIGLLLGRVAMFGVIDSFFMAYIGAFYVCSIVPYPGIVGVVLRTLQRVSNVRRIRHIACASRGRLKPHWLR